MIHTLIMMTFWAVFAVIAGLIAFPWTFISGKIDLLYAMAMWGAWNGVQVGGVRVEVVGLDRFDHNGTYIFMSNHASILDPPILVPLIPRRTSVLVKKELFRIPILAQAMRIGSLVPVDRSNREAAITSLRAAKDVLRAGINMTIFIEGTRSYDGRLLPFKKGPFYLAEESGIAIIPVTITGSYKVLPKKRLGVTPGTITVIFHSPIEASQYADRDQLMEVVRRRIASGLPEELQQPAAAPNRAAQSGESGHH